MERFQALSLSILFLVLSACTGVLHSPHVPDDSTTAATFSLLTMSSYDSPYAEWSALTTDSSFSYYECLVERTNIASGAVEESGIWIACSSPYDLTQAPGIDVYEGFNGQLTVRAVSLNGQVGSSITKKFRRAHYGGELSGYVFATKVQSDGKILVGGDFDTTGINSNVRAGKIFQFNQDKSPDLSNKYFQRGFNMFGQVQDVAVQSDGKILLGGDFIDYNDGTAPDRLIRLNSDGSIDTTFTGLTSGFEGIVQAIAIQSDGKILVGGNFTTYNGGASPDKLIRLNSDGTIDGTFTGLTSGFDSSVNSIAIQSDGKILVGGNFTTYNGGASPDKLIRLNSDGSVDGTFTGLTSGFDNGVYAITIQSDGKILVGGDFTTYNGGASPDKLIRLNSDGSVDGTFTGLTSGFDNGVYAITIQSDGYILVGGAFTTYNGGAAPDIIVRLSPTGVLDASFSGTSNSSGGYVQDIYCMSDGKIVVGGLFTTYNGSGIEGLVFLNSDGSIDSTVENYGFSGAVNKITLTTTNKILVGGTFSNLKLNLNTVAYGLTRLNEYGEIDTSFSIGSGFDAAVNAIAIQSDEKIIVGGDFTTLNGVNIPDRIVRLNTDGSVDSTFSGATTGFNLGVNSISLQSDEKIIVGGQFTQFNGVAATPDKLVRLNTDGSRDLTFTGITTGFNNIVYATAVQSDGKIIVGGSFTSFNGAGGAPDLLVRLNTDGSLDGTFATTSMGGVWIYNLSQNSSGQILVAGAFALRNGSNIPESFMILNSDGSLANPVSLTGFPYVMDGLKCALQLSSGKYIVSGEFTTYGGNVAAPDYLIGLNSDGTWDTSFPGGTDGSASESVKTMTEQSDGKIILGGTQTLYNGDSTAPDYLFRVNSDGTLDQSFLGQQH